MVPEVVPEALEGLSKGSRRALEGLVHLQTAFLLKFKPFSAENPYDMDKNVGKYLKTFIFSLLILLPGSSFAFASTHTVKKGETLYAIGRMYGVSVSDLRSANGLGSSSVLMVGQKLSIPEKGSSSAAKKTEAPKESKKTSSAAEKPRQYDVYTVQKGDTFYHIAKINNVTVAELKDLNGITSSDTLHIGQKLKIPATIVNTENASLPDLTSSDPRKYSSKKGNSSLVWPVKNPTVTYMTGKVAGVQLSAARNEDVCTIRAGTVMYTGVYRGYGQVVFVQSKTGHIYAYTGLNSTSVQKGDYVVFGDKLGTAGIDAINGASQISLMVFQKSNPIDPAKAPRG